jgi:hypothetical protein
MEEWNRAVCPGTAGTLVLSGGELPSPSTIALHFLFPPLQGRMFLSTPWPDISEWCTGGMEEAAEVSVRPCCDNDREPIILGPQVVIVSSYLGFLELSLSKGRFVCVSGQN